LLLVGGPRKARIAWGAVLLVLMTFTVGGLLPSTFAHDNVRLLAALAVCTWGLAPLRHRALTTIPMAPGVRLMLRPRTALAYTGVLTVAAVGVVVAVHERPIEVRVQTATDHDESLWGPNTDGCMSYSRLGPDPMESPTCKSGVDAVLQLNFSWATGNAQTHGLAVVQGQVGPRVARLVFIPVEGTQAITVPLLPVPTDTPLYLPRYAHSPNGIVYPADPPPPIPVLDGRFPGARSFSIAASSTDYASLLAFDADGKLIADGGQKLRNG
jgi:alpha-1,2-mannosyltransferase